VINNNIAKGVFMKQIYSARVTGTFAFEITISPTDDTPIYSDVTPPTPGSLTTQAALPLDHSCGQLSRANTEEKTYQLSLPEKLVH
jgi:hypothetical protein